MKKILIPLFAFIILVSPVLSFAAIGGININLTGGASYGNTYGSNYNSAGSGTQCSTGNLTLCSLIERVIGYLNQILFLLIALSVVVFVYYVFKYFIMPNEDRKQAGTYVMYSVIGFFVILSMWGLVNILQNTFGIGNSSFSHSSWNDITNVFPH
ncbi:MAG TPA: hypothetical protein VL335_01125 [Candidatus Paceibacterota bacterium]|jgi:hypothetical protein|nr:hypothetical protein [Candidatus Paceibacterota bacterium]